MSDDLFSDPDEPAGPFLLTPLEFSGVSGASSSPGQRSRPLTQQEQTPQPSKSATPQETTPKLYQCPTCKKKTTYKLFRNFKKHMLDKHNIAVTDDADVRTEPTEPSVSAPAPAPAPQASSGPTQTKTFVCCECHAELQTKRGFLNHRASHRIKEANKRMPKASVFLEEALMPAMEKVIEEILAEPAYCDRKAIILQEFNNKKDTPEWKAFVEEISNKICSFVLDDKQKKLLPMNQYEIAQTKLNAYLANTNLELREKFLAICVNADNFFINRLIFRMATKLLCHIQIWVIKKMSTTGTAPPAEHSHEMSDMEEKNFSVDLGSFLRRRFIKYRGKKDDYCACIKETFVDGEHPISKFDFLNEKNWFSGGEKCIVPSIRALEFFKAVEFMIRSPMEINSTQDIIEVIFERSHLLDHWFYLTNAYISEKDSLLFMTELVQHYYKMSLQNEEKRRNREEEQAIQANATAIRTHLNHNFAEREEGSESVE
ncbi:uncharacterized protein LOC127748885 [Frankliniella occidentalis]|uniref:Uncharacterized protein LOC127748885 n=1 Tax=Frankliniella occidentalis TaxID=133901 RepID=A0A9C6TZY1_FRAOC|nr:uncharacterized protein LOC127748885 [Frankliniella occidentalis]